MKNCVNLNFRNPSLSPLTKGGIKGGSGGLGSYFLLNSKGISVIFLVIALLLMITIGYVLTYLIPTKQKSVKFPIYSTQAYYIAQSGIEYGIRYSSDRGWRGTTDTGVYDLTHLNDVGVNQRSIVLGKVNERFTINYASATDTLTSTGEIISSGERRVIRVSNFSPFLRLIFGPASPAPCRTVPPPLPLGAPPANQAAQFYIKNVRGDNVILTAFSASWTPTGFRRLQQIYMFVGGVWVQKYGGNYASGTLPPVNFNLGGGSQTITSDQMIPVLIYWNFNLGGPPLAQNIIITFYTVAGDGYTFNLDAAGNGLPTC